MSEDKLTPEAVAQMVADRETGTPGPWFQTLKWEVGYRSDADDQSYGMMCPIIDVYSDCKEADINRVQRLPDLEAAYLTLAAENATLRASEAAALEALAEIERIYYTEGKDLSWRAAHMRAIATAILTNAAKG